MELRELRYFAAVAERLHYRRAAEQLGITQPALTKAIKRLEDEIGCRLLERSKRRQIRLTPSGQAFYEGVQKTLAESTRAVEHAQASLSGTAGSLSIGHTEDFVSDILPKALTHFTNLYPNVQIDLVQGASHSLPDMLLHRAVDCIFETTPLPMALPNCKGRALQTTKLIVLASATHPLAHQETVTPLVIFGG